MNRSRKILMLLVFFELFAVSVVFILDGNSFKNGTLSGTHNPNFMNPEEINTWYKDHYGTHKWIAEAALDTILSDSNANQMWVGEKGPFWTEKRKLIFLIGTEAPDVSSSEISLTLNGVSCHGMKSSPNVRFYPNDNSDKRMKIYHTQYKMMNQAREWKLKIEDYLMNGKCDLAAFYIGAIVHLVSDMACWPHLLDTTALNPPAVLGGISELFEKAIMEQTNDHYHREKTTGFTYPRGYSHVHMIPITAIKVLSFRIRWDYNILKSDINTRPFPSYVQPGSNTAEDLFNEYYSWSVVKQKDVSKWDASFKSIIQDHLNQAVRMCSNVIHSFYIWWAFNKECEECSGNDNDNYPKQDPNKWKKIGTAVSILVLLGIANTMLIPILQLYSYASHYF